MQVRNQNLFRAVAGGGGGGGGEVGGGEVGVFVELDHFDKNYVKKSRKKRPKEKYVGVFSPRYS